MEIKIASVDSLIIYFSNEISKETSVLVKNAYKILKEINNKALIEIVPSYNSILISYDIFIYDYQTIRVYIEELLKEISLEENETKKIITIDVYYGLEVGLDLMRISEWSKLSIEEVIALHSAKIYDIYAIGFLPGFAYMASVNDKISVSRLETPRKKIPKGSVAIANNQTAIYPIDSPGGWNIIGKTAFKLFDKEHESLSPLSIDTKIRFNPISKELFLSQGGIL